MAKLKRKPKKNIKTISLKNRAQTFLAAKQFPQALELFLKVARIDPRDVDAVQKAGVIYGMHGQHDKAAKLLGQAANLLPGNATIHYNLGTAFREAAQMGNAVEAFTKAVELRPDYGEALNSLSHALICEKKLDQAVEALKTLIALNPTAVEARQNLASTLQAQGKLEEAIENYQAALKQKPEMSIAWDGLGCALTSSGRYKEALKAYQKSLEVDPGNGRGHSNLLMTLNYLEDQSREQVFEEHRLWWKQHKVAAPLKPLAFDPDPDRPLRIGYVSPDFREHSVAYFIEPVLESHHQDRYDTWCYSSVPIADKTTRRLQSLAGHWRDISRNTPEQIAEQIRQDKIDLLVDLCGHTAGNHLAVFMQQPAPIQVTWLGYPNTTGLEVMDYRLVDAITDPVGSGRYCSEKLVRLPGCFLCYKPLQTAPDISPLPYDQNGFITFGSFNNLAKLSPTVIQLWADILKNLPDARLLLKTAALTDEQTRERVLCDFKEAGVRPGQLELLGHTESRLAHLELYSRIDIALDTFPYNGTTTTCEALWLGVPVITLCGDRHAARVSASLLKNGGLPELVAQEKKDYVAIASALARDPERLRGLRQGMRRRLMDSTLCDQRGFAEKMEQAYREMWQEKGKIVTTAP